MPLAPLGEAGWQVSGRLGPRAQVPGPGLARSTTSLEHTMQVTWHRSGIGLIVEPPSKGSCIPLLVEASSGSVFLPQSVRDLTQCFEIAGSFPYT